MLPLKIVKYSYQYIYIFILLIVISTSFRCVYNQQKKDIPSGHISDSATFWIDQSKNKKKSTSKRKEHLLKALLFCDSYQQDSLKIKTLLKIAEQAHLLGDTLLFKNVNQKTLYLSIKNRDTFGIADTHWNYGYYYSDKEIMDSAYYHYHKAFINFEAIGNDYYAGKMLYNLAFVQGRVKDYTGSEISSFQAISKFKELDRSLNLFLTYNHLGEVYNNLQEYNKAIFYHNKAMEYLDKLPKNGVYKEMVLNDLGLVYQKQRKFNKAIFYFKDALKNDSLKIKNCSHYARLIDNLAYTQFLNGDTSNVLSRFNKSLVLRDSLSNYSGIVVTKMHLAQFYAAHIDSSKAVNFANEAYQLASDLNYNRDRLTSLLLLSKIDMANAQDHLKEYVTLSNTLRDQERKIRNKFTRIRFETDEYIEKTEILSQQKILIIIASLIILVFILLFYYIRMQRVKNKELLFEQAQQKANEEIYSLMIKQQANLEEGRLKERHRIAEDLHDGILGKMFGTRMSLGFLSLKGDRETIEKHKYLIDELQQIEKEIRNVSHELKNEILDSNLNFISIVETLLKKTSAVGKFKYDIVNESTINWNDVDEKIKINCYRIIQEALQNVCKYANATFVNLDFSLNDKMLKLSVKDNGVGFNAKISKNGIGLKNITSRTKKINGEFKVDSVIGSGTSLVFLIPLIN